MESMPLKKLKEAEAEVIEEDSMLSLGVNP